MRPRSNTHRNSGDLEANLAALEQQFAEVLRPDEAKEPILSDAMKESIAFWMHGLRSPEILTSVGLKPLKRVMLVGPPGCGKTSLAHHLAARLRLPLVSIQSEGIIDKYVGQGAQNVGRVFDLILPIEDKIIVLWDEIDSIASKRKYDSGADGEKTQVVNTMLRRIDGYSGITIAATNRKDVIDSAAWRRFESHLNVDLPGELERFAILKRYAHPFDLGDEAFDKLVAITANASPALLEQVMNGMKRRLVMAPAMKRPIGTAIEVFDAIRQSVEPPEEIMTEAPVAFWSTPTCIRTLADMPWPPQRAK